MARDAFSRRLILIYAALAAGNIAAWGAALALFGNNPVLLGTALLAYALGLRHAVDADHIAAIDNTTRKLMQDGARPAGIGLFFSLGHSTVVVLASAAIALTSAGLAARFTILREIGGTIGTAVSAGFLFVIAAANIATLLGILRAMRRSRAVPALPGGPLGRLLKPVMNIVSKSWQMYPLGFLFGLGFDTASEVGLLGISAAQAGHVPFWTIMVFPALFTAAMSLVDTSDGVLMVGAYGWALVRPARKLVYNLTVTLFSILVALAIGAVEASNLLAERLMLQGPLWRFTAGLGSHFGILGVGVILALMTSWAASVLMARASTANS